MQVKVDLGLCQDYGQCVFAAPQVFQLDDDGHLVFEAEPGEEERANVVEAMMVCPMQAISIAED